MVGALAVSARSTTSTMGSRQWLMELLLLAGLAGEGQVRQRSRRFNTSSPTDLHQAEEKVLPQNQVAEKRRET